MHACMHKFSTSYTASLHCKDFLSAFTYCKLDYVYSMWVTCILLPNLMVHHYAVHKLHTPKFNMQSSLDNTIK